KGGLVVHEVRDDIPLKFQIQIQMKMMMMTTMFIIFYLNVIKLSLIYIIWFSNLNNFLNLTHENSFIDPIGRLINKLEDKTVAKWFKIFYEETPNTIKLAYENSDSDIIARQFGLGQLIQSLTPQIPIIESLDITDAPLFGCTKYIYIWIDETKQI
ncbi:hypothetical protein ACJX0J_028608, partial [Zea mays]